MLFNCFNCGRFGFQPMCEPCESAENNVPLDPAYYPEFQYESMGMIKDLIWKKKFEKELQAKLESVLKKYAQFESPYFVNYMHLAGRIEGNEVSDDSYGNLTLFKNVLVRLGFDELQELKGLTTKLVRTTSFRFQYHDFIVRTKGHVDKDIETTIRSWIEERGSAFKRYLPLLLYYLWEQKFFPESLGASENGQMPLFTNSRYMELAQYCEGGYFDIQVDRFKATLENFDPAKFITIYSVDAMDGYEFEDFLALLFTTLGYDVKTTKRSNDQGADLFAEKFGKKIVIQAKNYSDNVGNAAVQQVLAAKTFYSCDDAMVVTNSYFTASAKELAESGGVALVDRKGLQEYLDEYNRMIMDEATRAEDSSDPTGEGTEAEATP